MTDTTPADDLFAQALRKLPKFMRDHDAGREALREFWDAGQARAASQRANPMRCGKCGVKFADRQPGTLCPLCFRELEASQPAQEPFGWLEPETENFISNRQKLEMPEDAASYVVPLYAAPLSDQAWQDRIMELADDYSKATLEMALQKIHPGDLMRARAALEAEVRKL